MVESKSTTLSKKTTITFGKEDITLLQEKFDKFIKNGEFFEVELESKKVNESVIVTVELGEQ